MGSGNWIVDNLNSALEMWNGRLEEIWQLITTSPENFKAGGICNVIVGITGSLLIDWGYQTLKKKLISK